MNRNYSNQKAKSRSQNQNGKYPKSQIDKHKPYCTVMILFRQISMGKQTPDCSSLIRVLTVCYSICIVLTKYSGGLASLIEFYVDYSKDNLGTLRKPYCSMVLTERISGAKACELRREKTNNVVSDQSDTNQAVQPLEMARGWKFWI